MSYDPDEDDDRANEIADADRLCAKLLDCDLSSWDQDFVDDMIKRIARWGSQTNITARQHEQLERLKEKHNVKI